ncbi:MAG: hypothetical protein A4E25_01758 [Methanobacterium sp. PtaB.Bin024]|nr:MAG: hypothetical protein A4E25_01758 [Methanobacterium sp. PtaB.Bin024]
MILSSVVLPTGKVMVTDSVAVSPIVRSCVSVPLTFLDIFGVLVVTRAVAVVFMLFTAPAGCVGSPVLSPVLVP